jgi:hypothetical protein
MTSKPKIIATFHRSGRSSTSVRVPGRVVCGAPARCGAFGDERRVVAGDAGGRPDAHPIPSVVVIDDRERPVTSFAEGVRELALERMTALHTTVLIATFRCDAPARRGAFAEQRHIVAGASLVASFAADVCEAGGQTN